MKRRTSGAACVVQAFLIAACSGSASVQPSDPGATDGGADADATSLGDGGSQGIDGAGKPGDGSVPPGDASATDGAVDSGPASGRDWTQYPAVVTVTGTTEIDALGDIHGDPDTMVTVLKAAGLVSASAPYAWTGGSKVLVVTGDVIDKGAKALPAIDLLTQLEGQAKAAGGQLIVTLGNHEAEFMADPSASKSITFQTELTNANLVPADVAAGASPYGAWLRTRPIAALVDGWFFSHAGNAGGASAAQIASQFQTLFAQNAFADPAITGPNSVIEARQWWTSGSSSTAVIDQDLAAIPATHIVFGHQPGLIPFPDDPQGDRSAGTLAMRYAGRIFLIDTGMSYAVGDSTGSLLRIQRGSPTVASTVFADGTTLPLWSGN